MQNSFLCQNYHFYSLFIFQSFHWNFQVDGAGIFNNCVCRANDINYDDYYYVNYYYANYINELYQDVLYGDEAAPEGETEEEATQRKRRAVQVKNNIQKTPQCLRKFVCGYCFWCTIILWHRWVRNCSQQDIWFFCL